MEKYFVRLRLISTITFSLATCRALIILIITSACAHQKSYIGETAVPLQLRSIDCVKLAIADDWSSLEKNMDYCKNFQNTEGISPLMICAYKNRPQIFEKLIAAGSDVNLKDKSGSDALFYAVNFHRVEMIKQLRASGAQITMNTFNVNALWVALQKSKFEVIEALAPKSEEVNLAGDDGWTALYFAIRREESEALDLILAAGAHSDIKDSEGVSPYQFAKNEVKWSYAVKSLSRPRTIPMKKRAK